MELARKGCDAKFLSLAIRSLTKAQEASAIPLPIVSALLAQAEGSLGLKEKWKKNLRLEWFTWPPGLMAAWFLPVNSSHFTEKYAYSFIFLFFLFYFFSLKKENSCILLLE